MYNLLSNNILLTISNNRTNNQVVSKIAKIEVQCIKVMSIDKFIVTLTIIKTRFRFNLLLNLFKRESAFIFSFFFFFFPLFFSLSKYMLLYKRQPSMMMRAFNTQPWNSSREREREKRFFLFFAILLSFLPLFFLFFYFILFQTIFFSLLL